MDAGADYIGLVFFPEPAPSRALEAAQPLAQAALGRIETVAVTVDPDDALIDRLVTTVHPDLLQLHGSETADRVASIRARFGLPIIKAIGVASADDVAKAAEAARHSRPDPVRRQGARKAPTSPAGKAGSVSVGVLFEPPLRRAPLRALGRPRSGQCVGGAGHHRRRDGRCSSGVELANEKDGIWCAASSGRPRRRAEPKARAS